MKISTKTRYGLRALVYIAENAGVGVERLVRIKEISEAQKLSVQYLEQILFKLKKAKIIIGKRGPSGGYKLARNAEDISVFEVFQILEADVRAVMCDRDSEKCSQIDCKTFYLWEKLNDSIMLILKETSIQELVLNERCL